MIFPSSWNSDMMKSSPFIKHRLLNLSIFSVEQSKMTSIEFWFNNCTIYCLFLKKGSIIRPTYKYLKTVNFTSCQHDGKMWKYILFKPDIVLARNLSSFIVWCRWLLWFWIATIHYEKYTKLINPLPLFISFRKFQCSMEIPSKTN